MEFSVNKTAKGTISYPLHKHNLTEIMYYISGKGYLHTNEKDYEFKRGTIIIVPSNIMHGSVSKDGFINISVTDELMIQVNSIIVINDSESLEGEFFVKQIFNRRFEKSEYLLSLRKTFYLYISKFINNENSNIFPTIEKIKREISENAFDFDYSPTESLNKSGYSTDYIRQQFRLLTGKTPIEFLNEIRIKNACYLIDIYGNKLSLNEISEKSGFSDYAYFSKKFKSIIGVSPIDHKKNKS